MNKNIKYPLCVSTWDKEEIRAMNEVIATGMFTQGKLVKKFEREFASFFGSKYACLVNSGSSANLLAIASLFYRKNNPLQRGDEVIVPAVSWATTYAPLQQFGLKVKFVDIDLETLNISTKSLRENISENTKLVLGVNLLGNSVDAKEILKIVNSQKEPPIFVEDNCESMGAEYFNKFTGTHGLVGTYSMFFSHHISTMEGGVIVTDDEEIYQILLSIRSHGWTRGVDTSFFDGKNKEDFYNSFKFILPGYNVRSGELNAAIGLEQLKKLPKFLERRRKNAKLFQTLCKKYNNFFSTQRETGKSSWFGFAILCKTPSIRNKLVAAFAENNIEARPIVAGNFVKNPVIKFYDYTVDKNGLLNSNIVHNNGLFIGNNHIPMEKMLAHLDMVLQKALL